MQVFYLEGVIRDPNNFLENRIILCYILASLKIYNYEQ
jgi:hypothetical protein